MAAGIAGEAAVGRFRAAVCALLAILAVAAGPARAAGVVRVESDDEVLSWDPHAAWHLMSINAFSHVYETLVHIGPDLTPEPALATSWRLAAPVVWEVELRPGVRFQDGTPLTAEDVAFSLLRAKGESSDWRRFALGIARVEDAGGGKIRIVTERPDPLMPNRLAGLRIMSKAWADAHDAVAADRPGRPQASFAREHAMGTGPFRLVEGGLKRFALERNPDWWGRERWPIDVDRVEFTTNDDSAAQVADLLAGRVDFLPFPESKALDQLRAAPGVHTFKIPTLRLQVLVVNQGAPELASSDVRGRNPFRDRRVRLAAYQAIDIARLQREAGNVDDVPIGMPVPPGINGYDPGLDRRLPYDPEGAKRLLAEAGYPDGFKVRLDRYTTRDDDAFYASLTAMLGDVGIRVEQARLSDAEVNARQANRTTDLYRVQFGTSLYDGLDYLETLYRSGGNGTNASGYSNPELDALLDQIGTEMSTYVRDALMEKAWRIALGDVVHVPLFRIVETWAMRDRLELPPDPRLRWDFRYAKLRDAPR